MDYIAVKVVTSYVKKNMQIIKLHTGQLTGFVLEIGAESQSLGGCHYCLCFSITEICHLAVGLFHYLVQLLRNGICDTKFPCCT